MKAFYIIEAFQIFAFILSIIFCDIISDSRTCPNQSLAPE